MITETFFLYLTSLALPPPSQSPPSVTNTAQSPEEQLPPKALIIDLDHNKFKCKIAECSKAFRKAKMLHYHMKYYHGIEKAESDQGSPKRSMQTRGSCASETESLLDSPKRRRTTSGSLREYLAMGETSCGRRRQFWSIVALSESWSLMFIPESLPSPRRTADKVTQYLHPQTPGLMV